MTEDSAEAALLRAVGVSFAPQLFRSAKPIGDVIAPAHYLLHDVSFEVFRSDRVAIVGASGSGKTTLLRLLNRLSEPTSGALYLNGESYTQTPPVQLRQQIVLVLQESKLLDMTVQEALAYPLHLRGVPKNLIQQQIAQWTERLHVPTDWLHRTEQQLSVGQRQMVAIARALITQPQILLLDEPTSALDVGRVAQVLDVLHQLSDRQQTTIVMVNHQLDLAQRFSNRVFYLDRGRLVADQPTDEIDWAALEHRLQATEAEQAAEWNE